MIRSMPTTTCTRTPVADRFVAVSPFVGDVPVVARLCIGADRT
jgi:hypothetical protein